MKRIIAASLSAALLLTCMAGCGAKDDTPEYDRTSRVLYSDVDTQTEEEDPDEELEDEESEEEDGEETESESDSSKDESSKAASSKAASSKVTSSKKSASSKAASSKAASSKVTSSKAASSKAASSKAASSKAASSKVTSSKAASSKTTTSKTTSSKDTTSKTTSSKDTSSKDESSKTTSGSDTSSMTSDTDAKTSDTDSEKLTSDTDKSTDTEAASDTDTSASDTDSEKTYDPTAPFNEDDLCYKFEGDTPVDITLGKNMQEVKDAITEDTDKSSDCVYNYNTFKVYTVKDGDSETVSAIVIVSADGGTATEDGVRVGDDEERIKEVYGTNYTVENGNYVFTGSAGRLEFRMDGTKIKTIVITDGRTTVED